MYKRRSDMGYSGDLDYGFCLLILVTVTQFAFEHNASAPPENK